MFPGLQAMEALRFPCSAESRLAFTVRENLASISASRKGVLATRTWAHRTVFGCTPHRFQMPKVHVWCFAICDGCIVFNLGVRNCACYLPGCGVVRGTLPTAADHHDRAGNGFALVAKARAVGP